MKRKKRRGKAKRNKRFEKAMLAFCKRQNFLILLFRLDLISFATLSIACLADKIPVP